MNGALRLGTRASALARWQAGWVSDRLREVGVEVELVTVSTQGDRDQRGPVEQIGTQGVFTNEIQRVLLDGHVDLAVHSLKDLPTEPTDGLLLSAVPARAPTGDVLVTSDRRELDALERGARVGTGSLRRQSQLLSVRPDLRPEPVRGNVQTRLDKLEAGAFDALILAEAGLRRLGLEKHIGQILPRRIMLPAVGQGALGIETRSDDRFTLGAIACLDDPSTHAAVLAERALLAGLRGGCLAPVGALAEVQGDRLSLTGRVLAHDGSRKVETEVTGLASQAVELGKRAASELLGRGAGALIDAARDRS